MIVTQSKLTQAEAYHVCKDVLGMAKDAGKFLHINVEKYWKNNNCCYINFELDKANKPSNLRYQLRDVCHARLYNQGYAVLYFNYRPVGFNIIDLVTYIDWLVNESPFAGIFISKNVSDILAFGALIDTKEHYGLAFAAAIATRTYYEHGRNFVVWRELFKGGVDKTAAYVIAMATKATVLQGDAEREDLLPVNQLGVSFEHINHGGVDPYGWSKEAVDAFINKTPVACQNLQRADLSFCDNRRGEWLKALLYGFFDGKKAEGGKKFGPKVAGELPPPKTLDAFVIYAKEVIEPQILGMKRPEKKIKPVAQVVKGNGQEPVEDM